MKLVVLGSGAAVPHHRRSSSGYWLETSAGTLLLDCGASIVHRIAEENLDWANLDAIWISHFHLDHVGGLFPFLFGTKNAEQVKNRRKTLRIFGAQGLRRLLESFDKANDYKLFAQRFPLELIEVAPLEQFEVLPQLEALAVKTPHTAESLALRLTDISGKTIVYTSDTGFAKEIGTLAQNADLLVLECSFFRNKPIEKHLELAEAMYLVRRAKPKKVVLTHFYAEWDAVDFKAEVEKYEPSCEIIEAQDGLKLEI